MIRLLHGTLLTGYLFCTAALAVYGINCLWMIWCFARSRERQRASDRLLLERFRAERAGAPLPVVTTQIPLYNEKYVAERVIRAVCALEYPRGRHEIQVLDDSTDETRATVAALVEELRASGHDIHHLVRERRTGFKAGALAFGMERARGEYFAVFDADFVPEPDFLLRTVPFLVMDSRCAFVQTRWGHLNRDQSVLTQAQALGIDGHFVVEQSARAWNGLFLNFNGTAGVWRGSAIASAGGWSADTVTEDLALSYRAQLEGFRGRFLFDVVTAAELPDDLNDLKSQQRRWAKGSIQTAVKILPRVLAARGPSLGAKLQAALHLTHYLVHPLMLAMMLQLLPLLLLTDGKVIPDVLYPAFLVVLASLVAPSCLYAFSQRATYQRWGERLLCLPILMGLGIGLAVNNSRGVLDGLLHPEGGNFVRTPKRGAVARSPGATGSDYRTPFSAAALLEPMMALWSAGALLTSLALHQRLVGPLLALHVFGYLYVGLSSLLHHLKKTRSGTGQ